MAGEMTYRELRERAESEGTLEARSRVLEHAIDLTLPRERLRTAQQFAARLIDDLDASHPIEMRIEWLRDFVTPAVLAMHDDPHNNACFFAWAIARACRNGSRDERLRLRDAVLDGGIADGLVDPNNRAALGIASSLGHSRHDVLAALDDQLQGLEEALDGQGNETLDVIRGFQLRVSLTRDETERSALFDTALAGLDAPMGPVLIEPFGPSEAMDALERLTELIRVEREEGEQVRADKLAIRARSLASHVTGSLRTDEDHERLAQVIRSCATVSPEYSGGLVLKNLAGVDVELVPRTLLSEAVEASAMMFSTYLAELNRLFLPRQLAGWAAVDDELIGRAEARLGKTKRDQDLRRLLGADTSWVGELDRAPELRPEPAGHLSAACDVSVLDTKMSLDALHPWERIAVADLCGIWDESAAVGMLERLAQDDSHDVCEAALAALARRAPGRLIELAKEWVRSEEEDERATAVIAAQHFDQRWDELDALVHDESGMVRDAARQMSCSRRRRAGRDICLARLLEFARQPVESKAGEAWRAFEALRACAHDQQRWLLRAELDPELPSIGRALLHKLCNPPGIGCTWHGVIRKTRGNIPTTSGSACVEVLLCERRGRPWAASLSPTDPHVVFDRASIRGRWQLGLRDPFESEPSAIVITDPVLEVTLDDGSAIELEPRRGFWDMPTHLLCTAPS